ncbi:MAG: helix-turn-helix transcriptional regulator [Candidatus Paceibacterota bacterium]
MVVLYHNGWCKAQRRSILGIMNEATRLGKNLKRIRKAKDISQGEISRILDLDKGFISNIEAGKTNPTLATIAKIAKAIGVSVGELMK